MDAITAAPGTAEVPPEEKREVEQTFKEIMNAERHWKVTFDKMRRDQKFTRGLQWDGNDSEGQAYGDNRQDYVANFTLRMIQTKVASIYARNPTLDIKPRETMDYQYWTGDPAELTEDNPLFANIIAEREVIKQVKQLRVAQARTLGIVLKHEMEAPRPNFKAGAKATVRRALINGVGYCKLGFRRVETPQPEKDIQTGTPAELAARGRALYSIASASTTTDEQRQALNSRIQQTAAGYQAMPSTRAGLVFSWPWATDIVIDPGTRSLIELQGCRWLAEIYYLTRDEVLQIYGVDLEGKVSPEGVFSYNPSDMNRQTEEHLQQQQKANNGSIVFKVYELWDRRTGTVKTICQGYNGYVRAPAPPLVVVEGFFPYYPFAPNPVEDESNPFPPSEVSLIRDMQVDHNKAMQLLRDHRTANRPGMVAPAGLLEQTDKDKLRNRQAFTVVETNLPISDTDLSKILRPIPTVPIDPALVDTSPHRGDMELAVGMQEANLGTTAGTTATEVGVAESTRQTSTSSITDDLDEWLSSIFRAGAQIVVDNLSQAEAEEIAGRGARWPAGSGNALAQDLLVSIKAGSSGRPNKQIEVANWRDLLPLLMQIPGVKPEGVFRETVRRMGDEIDLEDIFAEGLPSIAAVNSMAGRAPQPMAQGGLGDPQADPAMQGGQGVNNTPQSQGVASNVDMPVPGQ